ncbi:hypothetical protein F5Y16DRAFT_236314 [Xylariaceae sp. FL0255]|nr:hypothetical protein F5Y16DRAFT_236314 [Xylariaceae sp. FL0255]
MVFLHDVRRLSFFASFFHFFVCIRKKTTHGSAFKGVWISDGWNGEGKTNIIPGLLLVLPGGLLLLPIIFCTRRRVVVVPFFSGLGCRKQCFGDGRLAFSVGRRCSSCSFFSFSFSLFRYHGRDGFVFPDKLSTYDMCLCVPLIQCGVLGRWRYTCYC